MNSSAVEIKDDFIYADLTYKIIGALFEVFNTVGSNHKESFYQKATAHELRELNLSFKEQLPAKIAYKGKIIGAYYFDFLIENKIVLELKSRDYFSKKDIDQIYSYLKSKNLKLGIIAHFTKRGVKIKRVANIK